MSYEQCRKAGEYLLIIDEVIGMSEHKMQQLKKTLAFGGIFNGIAKTVLTDHDDVTELVIKDKIAFYNFINRDNCDSKESTDLTQAKEILEAAHSDTRSVFIHKMENSEKDAHCIEIVWNTKHLEHFRGVRILAAGVAHSLMFYELSQYYKMVDITATQTLRNMKQRMSKLVIIPLFEDIRFSKAFFTDTVVFKSDVRDRVIQYYSDNGEHNTNTTMNILEYTNLVGTTDSRLHFQDKDGTPNLSKTLRVGGKDDYKNAGTKNKEFKRKNGVVMSSKSHGQNDYQHFTMIMMVAAFNLSPHAAKVTKDTKPLYSVYVDLTLLTYLQ